MISQVKITCQIKVPLLCTGGSVIAAALQPLRQRSLEEVIQPQNIIVTEYTLCQQSGVLAFDTGVHLLHGLKACTSVQNDCLF